MSNILRRLSGGLVIAAISCGLQASTIPQLGENRVRTVELGPVEIQFPTQRAAPAIADLNLTSDDPNVRRFGLAWVQRVEDTALVETRDVVLAAIVDAQGDPIAGPTRIATYSRGGTSVVSNPTVSADASGYMTVAWSVVEQGPGGDFDQTIMARTFRPEADDGSLCPADGLPSLLADPFDPSAVLLDTALVPELADTPGSFELMRARIDLDSDASAAGRTVIVFPDHRAEPNWGVFALSADLDIDDPLPDPSEWCEEGNGHARLLPPDPANALTRIAGNAEYRVSPRVAINTNNERAVVGWRSQVGAILTQRLDPVGGLLGDRIEVAARPDSVQESLHGPDLDYGPDGFFRVVWEQTSYQRPGDDIAAFSQLRMSRFDDSGNPIEEGLPIERAEGSSTRKLHSLRDPRIQARDLDGNFAVGWSRQTGECPNDNVGYTWFTLAAAEGGCLPDDGAGDIFIAPVTGSCGLSIQTSSPSDEPPRCRAQMRIRPIGGVESGQIRLDADGPWGWDDFGPPRSTTLRFGPPSQFADACVRLEWSDSFGSRSRTVRQLCSGSNCVSCEDQAQAAGRAMPAANAGPGEVIPTERTAAPASSRAGAFADADLQLRWFQRDYRTDEATPVGTVTISDQPQTAGSPALAMTRQGDMLAGWIARDVPDPDGGGVLPTALVTQNLTGPVELSINDIGILEGPLGRATANFTLTADKAYPTLPGTCSQDTPVPVVSLLTADGSASFLSGDYIRTTATLAFDPCDPLAPLSVGFSVPVEDDEVFEDTESFFVDLFDEANAIVVRRQGVGAIVDNDPPATVLPPDGPVEICEDGTVPLAAAPRCPGTGGERDFVEIELTLDVFQEVEGSVEFLTLDGSPFGGIGAAFANADYEPVSGELQFLPGNTSAFLSVDLVDDGFAELPEQFFVELIGADNLTLPADPDDLFVNVTILDDDACDVAPQWFLPDPGAPTADVLPTTGTETERTGYFCVVNPAGIGECPWLSELDLEPGEEPWLARTDIPFDAPPAGVSAADLEAARSACAAIGADTPGDPDDDATGAIRYVAEENLPDPTNPVVVGRTQGVQFINGAVEPEVRDVTQAGGDCAIDVAPGQREFFPVGGTARFDVTFGDEPACEFIEWTAAVDAGAAEWLSIDGATSGGNFTFNGPGSFTIDVEPYLLDTGPALQRTGTIAISGQPVLVVQEAPFFDHFDDGVPPDPVGWRYTEPDSWSEAGTRLTAATPGRAEVIADPAFPGCSDCLVETDLRFDTFGKGRATVYMWWRSDQNHLALTADEFFDTWTLVQRVNGTDHVLKTFNADLLVGVEYAVRIEYTDELGGPLLLVEVGGDAMCPEPGPGVEPCTPFDPDPDDPDVDPVVGSGTVGYAVEEATISFNRLRVIRADRLAIPLGTLFLDGFESP